MEFKFSPCRADEKLEAVVSGDILVLNGVVLDFGSLPDGASIPTDEIDNPWVPSDVERAEGVIRLTLRIPHSLDAPHETRFPTNFNDFRTFGDGVLPIPAYD